MIEFDNKSLDKNFIDREKMNINNLKKMKNQKVNLKMMKKREKQIH